VRVTLIRDSQGDIAGALEILSENSATRRALHRVLQLEQRAFWYCRTRIPNRRCLEFRLHQILEELPRYERRQGMLLLDLDRFEQINDKYGYQAGDAALIVTAQTITRSLRAAAADRAINRHPAGP
jgi:GGDEF domain-containing protein